MTAHVGLCWVDIKDVALAHFRALVRPDVANKRFILDSGSDDWFDNLPSMIEDGLKEKGRGGYPLTKRVAGSWLLGFFGMFNKEAFKTK